MAKNSFIDWDGNEIEVNIPIGFDGNIVFSREPLTIEFRASGGVSSDFPAFLFRELTLQLVSDTVFQYKDLQEKELPIFVSRNGKQIFAGNTVAFDYSEPVTPAPYITTVKALEESVFRLENVIQPPTGENDLQDIFNIMFGNDFTISSENAINKFWNGKIEIRQRFLVGFTVRELCEELASSFCGTWYIDYELNAPNLFIHDYSDVPTTESYKDSRLLKTAYRSLNMNTLGSVKQITYNDIFAKDVPVIKRDNFTLPFSDAVDGDGLPIAAIEIEQLGGANFMRGLNFRFTFNYKDAVFRPDIDGPTGDRTAKLTIRIRIAYEGENYFLDFDTGEFIIPALPGLTPQKTIDLFTITDIIQENSIEVQEEFTARLFPGFSNTSPTPPTDPNYNMVLLLVSNEMLIGGSAYDLTGCNAVINHETTKNFTGQQKRLFEPETIKTFQTLGKETLKVEQVYGTPKLNITEIAAAEKNILAANALIYFSEPQTGSKIENYVGGQIAYSRDLYERFLTQPIIYLDGEFRNDDLPEALERFKLTTSPTQQEIKDGVLRTLQSPLLPFLYDYKGDGTLNLFNIGDTATYKAESNHVEGRFVLRRKELPPQPEI